MTPYYQDRYGQRGWQFTMADSAWLAGLPQLGAQHTTQQIQWLRRLLASRGMPGWMLELHLRILHRRLQRALPGRGEEWGLLEGARRRLEQDRLAVMPDATVRQGEQEFARAVGAAEDRRAKGAARILLGAVADQRQGVRRAVASTLSWFTEPEAVPDARWRAAARELVERYDED